MTSVDISEVVTCEEEQLPIQFKDVSKADHISLHRSQIHGPDAVCEQINACPVPTMFSIEVLP